MHPQQKRLTLFGRFYWFVPNLYGILGSLWFMSRLWICVNTISIFRTLNIGTNWRKLYSDNMHNSRLNLHATLFTHTHNHVYNVWYSHPASRMHVHKQIQYKLYSVVLHVAYTYKRTLTEHTVHTCAYIGIHSARTLPNVFAFGSFVWRLLFLFSCSIFSRFESQSELFVFDMTILLFNFIAVHWHSLRLCGVHSTKNTHIHELSPSLGRIVLFECS